MGATWKRICACLVFVIAALCLPAAAFADTATVSLQGNYRQADARSMLQLVNDFRAESDLWVWDQTNSTKLPVDSRPAYIYDYGLEQAAKLRAREIALCYSHTRPDGSDPWTAYPTGIFYGGRSENIAAGQRDVAAAFNAWREDNDPYAKQGHRRAMLGVGFNSDGSLSYRNYAYIGIACFEYDGRKYWVQEISINPTNIADPGINDEPGFFDVTTDTAPFERGSISIDASSLEVDHQTPVDLPKITAELFVGSDWSWGGYHYPRKAALPVKPTSVYIEDTSIAAIEDGKIVPKMGGATRLIAYWPPLVRVGIITPEPRSFASAIAKRAVRSATLSAAMASW